MVRRARSGGRRDNSPPCKRLADVRGGRKKDRRDPTRRRKGCVRRIPASGIGCHAMPVTIRSGRLGFMPGNPGFFHIRQREDSGRLGRPVRRPLRPIPLHLGTSPLAPLPPGLRQPPPEGRPSPPPRRPQFLADGQQHPPRAARRRLIRRGPTGRQRRAPCASSNCVASGDPSASRCTSRTVRPCDFIFASVRLYVRNSPSLPHRHR